MIIKYLFINIKKLIIISYCCTLTLARYIRENLATTAPMVTDNEPWIWKQAIYCQKNSFKLPKDTKSVLEIYNEMKNKNLADVTNIYRDKEGRFGYYTLDCYTYGPIIIVGLIAGTVLFLAITKRWVNHYQHNSNKKVMLASNQNNEFQETTPFLSQVNDNPKINEYKLAKLCENPAIAPNTKPVTNIASQNYL